MRVWYMDGAQKIGEAPLLPRRYRSDLGNCGIKYNLCVIDFGVS